MLSKLLPDIELTIWPLVTLVIFSAGFLGLLLWVYRPSRKGAYLKFAEIPLKQNENV